MPNINASPKSMSDGGNITLHTDVVSTTATTFAFTRPQKIVTLRNKGTKQINYTIGGNTGTLNPSDVITVANGPFANVQLTASSGNQAFEIISDEVDSTNGTTANRPTANLKVGYPYYDTTLGKPVWWNGTVWKDATGTTV